MGKSVPQVSFASGELSPALHGRIDFQGYQNGLRTCRNFVVQKGGGVRNRPGTRFISEVADSAKASRLIPFQFSVDQSYVLELGNQVMRIFKNGALVSAPVSGSKAITNVASGTMAGSKILSHAVVTCPAHGFTNINTVVIASVVGAVEVNGTWGINVLDANTFELIEPIPWADSFSTATSAYVSGGTAIQLQGVVSVQTPWASADLRMLKFTQNNDVLTVCHPSYPPQQISRYSDYTWRVRPFAPANGPFLDGNLDTTKTMYVSAVDGDITITANFSAFSATDIGRLIRVDQIPDGWTSQWQPNASAAINSIVKYGPNYYTAAAGGTTGTISPTHTEGTVRDGVPGVAWRYLHSGYGVAKITGYTDPKNVSAAVKSRFPDSLLAADPGVYSIWYTYIPPLSTGLNQMYYITSGVPFSVGDIVTISGGDAAFCGTFTVAGISSDAKGPYFTVKNLNTGGGSALECFTPGLVVQQGSTTTSYKWAFQAWGNAEGYPGATGYYQQRQLFGGMPGHPATLEMSRVAAYNDFGVSFPILDDDAITTAMFSRQAVQVRHFMELNSLIVLTSGGVFVIKGGASGEGVLTPATVQAKLQAINAAGDVPPLRVNHFGLFVQEKGSQVRSLAYSFTEDSFIGQDITVVSDHLFRNHSIVEWAYQEIPNSCVWSVREDGALLGLTFVPDQQVTAWHRHDTDGSFESVCCISEGSEDAIYLVVNRTINGVQKRYIERMDARSWTDIRDAFFVDCGLSYDCRNAAATTMTINGGTLWDNTETLTVTASAPAFAAGNVGDLVVFSSVDSEGYPVTYRLLITAYTSASVVSVIPNRPLPAAYQNAARTDWALAARSVSGLNHLEGKTVSVLADGYVQTQKVVTAGSIALDQPAVQIHVGLPITADIETLEIGQAALRDKRQTINRLSIIVEESAGIQAGPDPAHLMLQKPPFPTAYNQPTELVSGLATMSIPANWSKAARVFIRQDQPLPLSILAVIPEVTAGGS